VDGCIFDGDLARACQNLEIGLVLVGLVFPLRLMRPEFEKKEPIAAAVVAIAAGAGLAAGSVAYGALPQPRDSANHAVPAVTQLEHRNGNDVSVIQSGSRQNLIRPRSRTVRPKPGIGRV
jgi:hypothetical protein